MAQTNKRRRRKHRGTQGGRIDTKPTRGRPRSREEAKARRGGAHAQVVVLEEPQAVPLVQPADRLHDLAPREQAEPDQALRPERPPPVRAPAPAVGF